MRVSQNRSEASLSTSLSLNDMEYFEVIEHPSGPTYEDEEPCALPSELQQPVPAHETEEKPCKPSNEFQPNAQEDEPSILTTIAKCLVLLTLPATLALASVPPLLKIIFNLGKLGVGPNLDRLECVGLLVPISTTVQQTIEEYVRILTWIDRNLLTISNYIQSQSYLRLFRPQPQPSATQKETNPYKPLLAKLVSRSSDRPSMSISLSHPFSPSHVQPRRSSFEQALDNTLSLHLSLKLKHFLIILALPTILIVYLVSPACH